jgi:hypothetical protein
MARERCPVIVVATLSGAGPRHVGHGRVARVVEDVAARLPAARDAGRRAGPCPFRLQAAEAGIVGMVALREPAALDAVQEERTAFPPVGQRRLHDLQ